MIMKIIIRSSPVLLWRLDYPSPVAQPHQHTVYQIASKRLQIWVRMLWYTENVDSCNGKYSETITSWHNVISLCKMRTKNFQKCAHIEPQSPGCLLHSSVPPLRPLFPTLWPLSALTLPIYFTLFFRLVSCTSSVFKVQTTKGGCLSP